MDCFRSNFSVPKLCLLLQKQINLVGLNIYDAFLGFSNEIFTEVYARYLLNQ